MKTFFHSSSLLLLLKRPFQRFTIKHFIRRLKAAILEPEMRKQKKIKDGILDEFEEIRRQIMQLWQETADAKRMKYSG